MKKLLSLFLFCGFIMQAPAQITDVVVLSKNEITKLKRVLSEDRSVKALYDSIRALSLQNMEDLPHPLQEISYEGLLDTNPARIQTMTGLADIDKVVSFIYGYYGDPQSTFSHKAKEFVLSWANTYQPTGNTINENKLVPLFWAYHLFQDEFLPDEKLTVENWMFSIASAQLRRAQTPNNNWEAKRQKIIATAGCILGNDTLKRYAVEGIKKYIQGAYYVDGTSNDLRDRDALHYHVSGLTPVIALFINCTPFESDFALFEYQSPSGASIRRSVEYTIPFATGKIARKEWVNSKVRLDKERAAAGLAKYQPGKLFDPAEAIPMFEWAVFYDTAWYSLLPVTSGKPSYTTTWTALLNSPLIRE